MTVLQIIRLIDLKIYFIVVHNVVPKKKKKMILRYKPNKKKNSTNDCCDRLTNRTKKKIKNKIQKFVLVHLRYTRARARTSIYTKTDARERIIWIVYMRTI